MKALNITEIQRYAVYAALVEYYAERLSVHTFLTGGPLGVHTPGVPTIESEIAGIEDLFLQLYALRGTITSSNK